MPTAPQTSVVPISLGYVNAFLITGERPVLVDTGNPGRADTILNALKKHGVMGKDLSLILLTHGHYDHFGSALELKQRTGAPVAIHYLDARWPRSGTNAPVVPTNLFGKAMVTLMSPLANRPLTPFEPEIILEDESDLSEYGIKARTIHTPGHTDGSISIIVSNGDVIAADLMTGAFFRKGQAGYPIFATDMSLVRQSIKKVLALHPRMIYVGHGSRFTGKVLSERFAKDTAE